MAKSPRRPPRPQSSRKPVPPEDVGKISQKLTDIFSKMQPDRLISRGRQQPVAQPELKRVKRGEPEALLRSEVVRLVAEFLDPFDIILWSGVCKRTREVCNLAMKLDACFSFFRIHKRYADLLHEMKCDWRVILKLLLEAFGGLKRVYGPYHVHPVHAALAGEDIFLQLWEMETRSKRFVINLDPTANLITLRGTCVRIIVGASGDYFITEDSELEHCFERLIKTGKVLQKFPPGPARELVEAKCMPFVPVFLREQEEHTDQIGICFPISSENTDTQNIQFESGSNDAALKIFNMQYQDLPCEDDDEDDFLEWYKGLPLYRDNCKSLAQAFCQYIPLKDYGDERSDWDSWNQLIRAGWLKFHCLEPFDSSNCGEENWIDLVQSLPAAVQSNLQLELSTSERSTIPDIHVLDWSELIYRRGQEGVLAEAEDKAMIYLRMTHGCAKGSHYV